ncbi:MAG: DUF4493 domain-containing protein [Alistipes sp.]|nr:DUF4493 domain-containing protein [Alistipes sp.]
MKKLMLIMAMAVGMVACHDEKVNWGGASEDNTAVGYIAFAENGLSVNVDSESAAGDLDTKATRAEEASADYTIEIWNSDNEMVATFKYGDREDNYTTSSKDASRRGVAVPIGIYTVKAYSAETPKESDTPQYAGETAVSVAKDAVAEASITCKLSSVKVSVRFDPILASLIAEDTKTRVVLGLEDVSEYTFTGRPVTPATEAAIPDGCSKLEWGAEGGYRYLRPNEDVNPLVLYLTTTYNGSAIKDQALRICDDAKPGEWRQVTVKLENGDSGTVYIVVEVNTWVEGEMVDVDVTTMSLFGGESGIPDDSDAPVIEWVNHDFTQMFTLTDAMFNTAGEYVEGAAFMVTTKSEIVSMMLGVSSTNSDLNETAVDLGLDVEGGLDLTTTLSSTTKMILGGWGFPISNIAGQTELSFDLSKLMKVLHDDYAGTHTFTITVADKLGSSTTVELNITSGLVIDPNVVWVGQNIDNVVDIYPQDPNDKTTMELLVTAKTGIKSLIVTVDGVLAPALPDVGLPTSFDLVKPVKVTDNGDGTTTETDISTTLNNLGFKTGDQVKDQTSVSFDITGFKTLLKVAPGVTKFWVDLTDNEGNNVKKAMQINIIVTE